MHKTWVFIIPAFFENRPQTIRFKRILSYHSNPEIKIIVLTNGKVIQECLFENIPNVIVRTFSCSTFGGYINRFYYPRNLNSFSRFLEVFRPYVRAVFKRLLFPDMFTIEYYKVLNAIIEIQRIDKINGILISSAPHSLLKLSKIFKSVEFGIDKILYDIGDPLYNNSSKRKRVVYNLLAKKYEKKFLKYVDKLLVTNKETKQHFQNLYSKSPIANNICILPMGGDLDLQNTTDFIFPAKDIYSVLYAGIFYKELRNPQPFFNAINQLNNRKFPNFVIDIFGNGMDYYKRKLPKELSKYVRFKGVVDNENILKLYDKYDFILHIDNAFGIQTPGKNYELFLSNKPIIFLYETESSSYDLFFSKPGIISAKNNTQSIIKELSIINDFKWGSRIDASANVYTWCFRYKQLLEIMEDSQC